MDYGYGSHTVFQIESALLGQGVLLCDGRANDGRDDQAIFGASL
jgi:hypothetical protein